MWLSQLPLIFRLHLFWICWDRLQLCIPSSLHIPLYNSVYLHHWAAFDQLMSSLHSKCPNRCNLHQQSTVHKYSTQTHLMTGDSGLLLSSSDRSTPREYGTVSSTDMTLCDWDDRWALLTSAAVDWFTTVGLWTPVETDDGIFAVGPFTAGGLGGCSVSMI